MTERRISLASDVGWVDKPKYPGVYWWHNKEVDLYYICAVVRNAQGELVIEFIACGQCLMAESLPVEGIRMYGPISLPDGHSICNENAVYATVEIAEPTK